MIRLKWSGERSWKNPLLGAENKGTCTDVKDSCEGGNEWKCGDSKSSDGPETLNPYRTFYNNVSFCLINLKLLDLWYQIINLHTYTYLNWLRIADYSSI